MKILITGATGFIGSALTRRLLDDGHKISILTRNKNIVPAIFEGPNVDIFEWKNTRNLPPPECAREINGVINLMGENLTAKRWNSIQKKNLRDSRILSTLNLSTLLGQTLKDPLDFFISASAIGIYPVNRFETLNEESPLENNFLANLCKDWESAAYAFKKTKRTVIIRTAVVLEKDGGALAKMLTPFKMGIGGTLGNGSQFMSWIHLDDLVNLYTLAATDSTYNGVYNGCAPNPVDNLHFTKALGQALHKPTIMSVPKFMLKLSLGEMSAILLDSQKIISKRLKEKNFKFHFTTIESAMTKIFESTNSAPSTNYSAVVK